MGNRQTSRLRDMNQQFGIPAGRALADPLDEPEPEVPTVPEPVLELEPMLLLDVDLLDPADLDRT